MPGPPQPLPQSTGVAAQRMAPGVQSFLLMLG